MQVPPLIIFSFRSSSILAIMYLLTKLGIKKDVPSAPLPGSAAAQVEETERLLEAGDITETEASVRKYLATESESVISTEMPEIPASIKSLLLFQSYAFLAEFASFVIALILSFKYFFSGCIVIGCGMAGLSASLGYLSVPQLMLPFSSNPLARWFVISNHSIHMTSVISAIGLFVYLTYFSWFNSCQFSKTSKLFLVVAASSVALFLVACYRNEKGNGGYIRWLIKLV